MGTGAAVSTGDAITAAKMNLKLEEVLNADVGAAAVIAWTKMAALTDTHILVGDGSNDAVDVAVSGDISIDNLGAVAIVADVIVNADVNSAAAIAWSKLAALTDAHVLVGNVGNVAVDVAISGDITLANDGTVAIAAGVIVNADVNAAAAIAWAKMAALTAAHILVGDGSNDAVDVAMSGDVAIDNAGATTIQANAVTIAKIEAALRKEIIVIGPILQQNATDFTVYFNHKVTINKVRSFLTVVLTTADSVITMQNNAATPMANGVLTITQAASAIGDENSCDPTTNNVIDAGEKIILSHDGGPDAGEAIFFIECTHTA